MEELAKENIMNMQEATELLSTHHGLEELRHRIAVDDMDYETKGQWYDRYNNKRKKHKKRR